LQQYILVNYKPDNITKINWYSLFLDHTILFQVMSVW